jgi:hypothetical protein
VLALASAWLVLLLAGVAVAAEDKTLFDFQDAAAAGKWSAAKLPEVKTDSPAPRVEVVANTAAAGTAGAEAKGLKLTFDGGEWPVVATTTIPVEGNWKELQTLRADLTVDAPLVAYFRVLQGQPDEKGKQAYYERTMILQPGRNPMTLVLHSGIGQMDPAKGNITSFIIGAFRPAKGQTLLVDSVRLSADWPPPKVIGWTSPYNHDGYSSAVAQEYARTGKLTTFKVLGRDMEVADIADIAAKLKDKWTKPEAQTIDQVEADFKAQFDKLHADHPRAMLAIFRDGEKGCDPGAPDKVYAGWKMVYISCHGPDGPNDGRENTPRLYDAVEAFMRHRSPLMRADLSSIPSGAAILAARLVVTRPKDAKPPEKPNMWVAEPCNRDWDDKSANCYFYAPGKLWKAVSGLYHGQDPDYWPVFLASGPAGGGPVSTWDFTEALKFWTDAAHPNHGFFLYGDSNDYARIYTYTAKEVKVRPAILVIYEPKG